MIRKKLINEDWFKNQEEPRQLALADDFYVEADDGFKGKASFQGEYWEEFGAYMEDKCGKKHPTRFDKMFV